MRGVTSKASDKAKDFDEGETKTAKVLTWVANSVETFIGVHLATFETAKSVWDY